MPNFYQFLLLNHLLPVVVLTKYNSFIIHLMILQVIKLLESLLENFQLILIYFMICFAKKLLKQIKLPIQWKLKHFYTLY